MKNFFSVLFPLLVVQTVLVALIPPPHPFFPLLKKISRKKFVMHAFSCQLD
jgi:hypothetical protein